MAADSTLASASPVGATTATTLRQDALRVARWATLGAAAGGFGGFLVGGIGGRLAMLLLRLTSPDWVRGLETDDGFVIGRFDASATAELLLITTILGSVVGLVVVFARPFFPKWMWLPWAIAGAAVGGAGLVHTNGIDYNVLEPTWLAILLFVSIPALGAAFIAWLVELIHPHWWRRWDVTILGVGFALPSLIALPVSLVAVAVAALWVAAMRIAFVRRLPQWLPARMAAGLVFVAVILFTALKLGRDARDLL